MIPTGTVTLQDVENEFGNSHPIPLGDYYVDGPTGLVVTGGFSTILGNPPYSGPISLADFRGVSRVFVFNDVVSSNLAGYNLRTRALAAGWNGTMRIAATITINGGVYVYATSTASPAFVLGTPTLPSGSTVTLTNNGFIAGRGGDGGDGGSANGGVATNGVAGSPGGPALSVNYAISITNNGTIGGGGGGGGGGSSQGYILIDKVATVQGASGGGGGGGRSLGGAGAAGTASGNPQGSWLGASGSAGTLAGQGAPGAGSGHGPFGPDGGAGGAGGDFGAAGSSGVLYTNGEHTTISSPGAGGAAGAAVIGNGFITWLVTGTRLGSIS